MRQSTYEEAHGARDGARSRSSVGPGAPIVTEVRAEPGEIPGELRGKPTQGRAASRGSRTVALEAMPQISARTAEVRTQFEAFGARRALAASSRQRGPDPA